MKTSARPWWRRALLLVAIATAAGRFTVDVAIADGRPRMVLISDGAPDLGRKIAAEAESGGFEVVERPLGDAQHLEEERGLEAVALIVVRSAQDVEIRVGRPDARVVSVLRLPTAEPGTFPLLVVEEVRARLVELRLWLPEPSSVPTPHVPGSDPRGPDGEAQAPQRSEPPAASSAAPVAAPRPIATAPAPKDGEQPARTEPIGATAWLWLGAGPAMVIPAGGLGPTAHGLVGATFEPGARWRLGGLAFLPLHDTTITGPEGEADISSTILAARIAYAPWRSGRWSATAGVGGGPLILAMQAAAPAPYVGREETAVSATYFLEAALERTFADWLRVQASAMVGVSAPRPVIRFDDRDAAAWGRTFGAITARADFGLSPGADGVGP